MQRFFNLLKKKCPLYKNQNISVIRLVNSQEIDIYTPPKSKKICNKENFIFKHAGYFLICDDLLTNKTNRIGCLFYDDEYVIQKGDVVFFSLACTECKERKKATSKIKIRWVLIDKLYKMLFIFDNYYDLVNYIKEDNYKYYDKIYLSPFVNIGFKKTKLGKSETYINKKKSQETINPITGRIEKYNPLELTQYKLFYNAPKDVDEYNKKDNLSEHAYHFNVNIKITKLFKFSSAHENKMQLFKNIIEDVVGFKILY